MNHSKRVMSLHLENKTALNSFQYSYIIKLHIRLSLLPGASGAASTPVNAHAPGAAPTSTPAGAVSFPRERRPAPAPAPAHTNTPSPRVTPRPTPTPPPNRTPAPTNTCASSDRRTRSHTTTWTSRADRTRG